MVNVTSGTKPVRYGFLLLPNASMADFAIATEVLTRANQLAEKKCYEFLPLSLDGLPVTLSNGLRLAVDLPLAHAPKLDVLVVLADEVGVDIAADELARVIGTQLNEHTMLAGINCGSYWLARAGLLAGHRATIHWQEISRLSDEFPDVIVSSNLYEIDGNRLVMRIRSPSGDAARTRAAVGFDLLKQSEQRALYELCTLPEIAPLLDTDAILVRRFVDPKDAPFFDVELPTRACSTPPADAPAQP